MSLPNIQFQKGSGGLGRPLAGQDHYSGLIFYAGVLPAGFSTVNRIKKFLSVNDAQNAGIKLDYSDETKATATVTLTAAGAVGDSISALINIPGVGSYNLGTYYRAAGDTTVAKLGDSWAAFVNAGTQNHGFTAVNNAGVVTTTGAQSLGIALNTLTNFVTASGGITITQTPFTGGVASRKAIYYYHISEFFRVQPKGILWVGIFAVPSSYTFAEIATMQNFSNGTIRQIGVYKDSSAFSTVDLTTVDLACKALEAVKKPLIGLYAADISGIANISSLTDLSTLTAYEACAVISQDGGAAGARLYLTTGKSITTLGATLGAIALAKVSEDIGWVQKFNMSNGTELEQIAFANGVLFTDPSITDNLLDTLDNYRYLFLRKFVGQAGTFHTNFNMAVTVSSDYAYGNDSRTIQKAQRGLYVNLLPALSGPLQLNSDGTLSDTTIAYLETLGRPNLDQMVRDGELSGTADSPGYSIQIDPTQNVLTTGVITISVLLIEVGTARQIIVPIAFTTTLSQ